VGRKKSKVKLTAQEVEDEEYQQVHERVCGIDVAKASAMVCVRTPPSREGGRRVSRVWAVEATVPAVSELAGQLLAAGVQVVSMESTSDYWRIWYYVLEQAGLKVQLVNSSQARQLAGRPKTDRHDAQWLARLTEMGMLRPSFVPPKPVRDLRDHTRARLHLVQDRTRVWQRLEKLLEGALIKLSSTVSSLARNKSAQAMITKLAEGERDPRVLAQLAMGPMRAQARQAGLVAALTGQFDDHHGELTRMHLAHIKFLDRQIDALDDAIEACLEQDPAAAGVSADGVISHRPGPDAPVLPAVRRLAEIPGVSIELARAIIAETGLDMTRFPTAGHLVSWAGLVRTADQSGPRTRKGRKGQGDSYLRNCLTQAANGAAGTDTFLGERFTRIARRRGKGRAKTAVARSILIIIWHLLADPAARFRDLGPGWHASRTSKDKQIRNHIRQLQALGMEVTITPAA
jgi:transposase